MKPPEYKQGRTTHSAPGYPRLVLLYISIDPKHFVSDDMKALASELRNSLPSERRIGVIILDDADALVNTSPIHRTSEYLLARRGYFYLDRNTGEEYIQFSTERKKRWDEILLCLGTSVGKCKKQSPD